MTAILPGQASSVAQIFQDLSASQRALKDADEVARLGAESEGAMRVEFQMRAEDGLLVKEGTGVGDINLTAQRYRAQASDMRMALSKLRAEDPDQADYASTVALQILGIESTGDDLADTILQSILGGDAADDLFLSARFALPDAVGTAGADALEVTTEGDIVGVKTGDGGDVVHLSGARVFDVSTDATPTIAVTTMTAEKSTTWMSAQHFASNDQLTITAGTAGAISTGGGDDLITVEADNLLGLDAGAGNDRMQVSADYINGINAGAGNDILTLRATLANGISGGEGSDAISLTAVRGDVDGGAGADLIRVSAREAITVRGGSGDDLIEVAHGGGTVTLARRSGDGDDLAILEKGANVTLAGAPPTRVEREGDLLRLSFADGGSLTLAGIGAAGQISLATARGGDPRPLEIPPDSRAGLNLRM